jgi:hypothetical protein
VVLLVLHVVDSLPPLDQNLLESIAECPSWTDEYVAVWRVVREPTAFRSSLSSQKSDCPTPMVQSQY